MAERLRGAVPTAIAWAEGEQLTLMDAVGLTARHERV
jgi:hypothetical protein